MDHIPSETNHSENNIEYASVMRFGRRHIRRSLIYVLFIVLTASLYFLVSYLDVSFRDIKSFSGYTEEDIKMPVFLSKGTLATTELIKQLKQYNLWDLPDSEEVPRFFIESFPADLNNVDDIAVRKKVFLHSLLPHALFVRQETLYKRNKLESILEKIDCDIGILHFGNPAGDGNQCKWTDFLTQEEVTFVRKLGKEYRSKSASTLLRRVDAIPVSIILAQGALESSWGSSRFTREGNSIFGMWTWNTKGIVPNRREEGMTHKVKIYENVLDSVRAYHLTLNRVRSYEKFRKIRLNTNDPLILAEGLKLYSERGQDYVEDIKNVILSNNLQKYENFRLSNLDLLEIPEHVSGEINPVKPGRLPL